jgi:hypothetical protein
MKKIRTRHYEKSVQMYEIKRKQFGQKKIPALIITHLKCEKCQ